MDARNLLASMLDSTVARVHRALTAISEEDARACPHGLSPIVWQVGHMVLVDSKVLTRSGIAVDTPRSSIALFETGTGGEADYPLLSTVLPLMSDINTQLSRLVLEATLDQPIAGVRSYTSIGEALLFVAYHRGYHIGKIATLRALLGKRS